MKINYSNKTLWRGIFIELIIVILMFLFIAMITKDNILLLIISLLFAAGFIYLASMFRSMHKKLFLDVSMEELKVYGIKGNLKHHIKFSDVKQLAQIKSDIYITNNDGGRVKLNLRIISFKDLKQLISYLQYNPNIENKNFHI